MLGDNFYSLLVLLATFSFHSVNTQNLKFGRRNRPDILASPRCEAFENLLQIDIAPVRRTLQGFTSRETDVTIIFIGINIYSFYVADKIRLGTVFVQHKKNV